MWAKKHILFFILIANVCIASAQDFPFSSTPRKQAVDADDKVYLKGVLQNVLVPEMSFGYNINTNDLSPLKPSLTGTEPTTLAWIKKVEASLDTLTDSLKRASCYLIIGQKYKKLNNSKLSIQNYEAAYSLLEPKLKTAPADSALLISMATIYMDMGNYQEAIRYFYEFQKVDSVCDIVASTFIPLLYLNMARLDDASEFLKKSLKKWPEGMVGLYYDMMAQIYGFTSIAQYRKEYIKSEKFLSLPPDSIFDFSKIAALYQKYPDSLKWEQFYKGAQLLGIYFKKMAILQDTVLVDDLLFNFIGEEKKLMETLKMDFERIAKSKQNKNRYLAYFSLGNIEFLNKNFKNSIKWFEKAIQAKEKEVSDFQSHAGGSYDNIIGCYLQLGDTIAAKRALLKKIKDQPEIDPVANDYAALGFYFWWEKNYNLAKENFSKALQYDSSMAKAYIGLGAIESVFSNPEKAKHLLIKGIEIDKGFGSAYLIYSIAALQEGDFSTAYSMLRAAHRNGYDQETVFEIARRFYPMEEF